MNASGMLDMEEFRIVFNLEIRERHRELWSAIGSGGTAEDAFWKRFRAQAHSDVAKDTRVLHAILRANFPGSLEEKLHDRLRTEFDPGPPRIDPDATRSSSRYLDDERSAERDEFFRALEKLRIEVKRIGSGSLELIVLVLGFTKFAELIGIDRDDFAKYFEIIAPSALNETFHTNVPLVADVTPTAASPPAATGSGGSEGRSGVGGLYVGFYLVPAIFAVAAAGAVLWVASAAFSGIATSLVEERKAIATNLHEEMKAITTERSKLNGEFLDALQRNEGRTADERRAVGEQLAAFLSKLTDTEQKKDLALDQAHKALFDAQMAFIGQANMGAKDRETAVVEFVKQRLTGSAAPIPTCAVACPER